MGRNNEQQTPESVELTPEQITAAAEAKQLEDNRLMALQAEKDAAAIVVDFTTDQILAMKLTDCYEKRDEIAANAVASVIRGKVQAEIDRNMKAAYIARSKNREAVAVEADKVIVSLQDLKALL